MLYRIGYTNTAVIYHHSTVITKVMLLYNTEWQYDHEMAVNCRGKKFYNIGPRHEWDCYLISKERDRIRQNGTRNDIIGTRLFLKISLKQCSWMVNGNWRYHSKQSQTIFPVHSWLVTIYCQSVLVISLIFTRTGFFWQDKMLLNGNNIFLNSSLVQKNELGWCKNPISLMPGLKA